MPIDNKTPNLQLPLPDQLNKLSEDVVRLQGALNSIDRLIAGVQAALIGKTDSGHAHAIAEIANLAGALDGKMASDKTFALADITDVNPEASAADYILMRSGASWVAAALTAAHIKSGQFKERRMPSYLRKEQLDARIDTAVASLVDGAPGAVDTLNELAAALADDPNFAATTAARLGALRNSIDTMNTQITELRQEEYPGYMDGPLHSSPTTIPIIRNAAYARTVNSITCVLGKGAGWVRLNIDGRMVAGINHELNTVLQTRRATGANIVARGQTLEAVFQYLSKDDEDLSFQVNCTRNFPG